MIKTSSPKIKTSHHPYALLSQSRQSLPDLPAFVGICRLKTDKQRTYTQIMEYTNRYIPREYLALKINYCKERLKEFPVIKLHSHTHNGIKQLQVVIGSHKYLLNSPAGQKYYQIKLERDALENDLKIYETYWDSNFSCPPPQECKPQKIIRSFYTGNYERVILDKAFFDSLNNDANTKHPKYKNYLYKGIYYRSAAERDIAAYYTENGIPFKYEPEIMLAGLVKPINTDFVIYIKELDNCKFHEHLGMKESADYLRDVKIKYNNYAGAGLVPEQDIIFTHDKEGVPFDIRYLETKLNSAVYGTLICHEFEPYATYPSRV